MLSKLSSALSALIIICSTIIVAMPRASASQPGCNKTKRNGRVVIVSACHNTNKRGVHGDDVGPVDGPAYLPCRPRRASDPGTTDYVCTTPDPANNQAAPQVSPADLAQQAVDALALPPAHINTSPSPRSYVRIRTGLWLDPADAADQTASATTPDGAVTVTATAAAQKVTWNLVENTVVCDGPGRPKTTECGYTYQRSSASQPSNKYRISATIAWNVHWECTQGCAAEGDLAATSPTSFLNLGVLEIQTESKPN
jgi:hypothetical protein